MSLSIKWLGHAGFRIAGSSAVIYIDPWKLARATHDASLVLISHSHYDHCSPEDIAKVVGPSPKIIGPADVVEQLGNAHAISPGETLDIAGVSISAVPSYNSDKPFHPKDSGWVGFVIAVDGKRIYYAGDTDVINEMAELVDIDLALVPVGGTYTMDPTEAAKAVNQFKPKRAIPYHWGDIVGSREDAELFWERADCEVTVLKPDESLEL